MTALPAEVTYGKVVGQFLLAVQDGVDADSLPDAQPAQGTIRFEPLQPNQRLLQPTPATLTSRLKTCSLDGEGFLVDAQGNRGVWLVTGRYQLVFRLKGARILPREILVTEDHTEMYPLDLAYTLPPEGSELTMSQYAELSDRVARAESGAGQDLALAARLEDPGSASYAAIGTIRDPQIAEQIGNPGSETQAALRKRVTVIEARDFGVVGDGVADDTAAVRDVFRAAALWTSNAKTGQKAEIHFPAGEFIITANNVFGDLTTASNVGLNVVGAGMAATRFKLVTGGAPMWFYDNGDTQRWQYVTVSDCAFTTDGPTAASGATETSQTGGFAKITSSGHEQFFKFFRCHFLGPWHTVFHTEGDGNADQIGLFACKVQDVFGHLMYINNQQSVIHEWYNVTATRLYGHGFTVGPNGGGDVKLVGGSWILMGIDADTTPRYLINLPNAGTGLGAGNGAFAAWGIKTETHRANMRLVKTPDNSIVRVSFRDCNLWTTHSTITDATIEQVTLGRRGHVIFDGCSIGPKFAATIAGPTAAQSSQDAETLLAITDCYVPSDITDRITITGYGRAIGTRLRGTDNTSGARRAMDFDMGWATAAYGGPSPTVKRAVLRQAGRGWPTPSGTSEWNVTLPKGAIIVAAYARRPGAGSASTTYQLHLGSDDKATIFASSAEGGLSSADAVIDARPMIDTAVTTSARTLRLWATGDLDAPGSSGLPAWVEYL